MFLLSRLLNQRTIPPGSEAIEAAVKLARQYHLEKSPSERQRTRFIARHQSYHGTTLGALAVGGHAYRRAKFGPLLTDRGSLVAPCHPYRYKQADQTDADYVQRLAQELNDEFDRVGGDTVCAFVVEPVVGAVSVFFFVFFFGGMACGCCQK